MAVKYRWGVKCQWVPGCQVPVGAWLAMCSASCLLNTMEEGPNPERHSGSWVSRRRDKAKMAWRHRSRNEKILLRIIGFLSFSLCCFIIAVTVMDLAYKAKIKNLENELDALKTTTPQAIVSTSDITDLTSDLTDSTSDLTTTTTITTTTVPTTTTTTTTIPTTTTKTTTTLPTTGTNPPSTKTTDDTTSTKADSTTVMQTGLLESLQSLLLDFSGRLNTKKTWEESNQRKGVLTRTRATVAILADIQSEESKPIKKESDPLKPSDSRDDTLVDIDNSLTVPPHEKHDDHNKNETESPPFDYEMSDTEDEDYWEGINGGKFPIDDSSAPHEGSGGGATPP